MSFKHPDAMPVELLHPAFVGSRVLRTVVDDGAPAEDFDVFDVPEIQAAVEVGPRGKIKRFAAPGIEALVIYARRVITNRRVARPRWGWGVGEQKQHLGVIQKVAWARDGEL